MRHQYRFGVALTEEDMIGSMAAFNAYNAYSSAMQRLSRRVFRISGGFMLASGLVNIVLDIYTAFVLKEHVTAFQWLAPVFVTVAGLMVFSSQNRRQAGKLMWRKYDKKGQTVSYLFGSADFRAHDRSGDMKRPYSDITDIFEDELRYYVFIGSREPCILPKAAAEGGCEGFGDFLEDKTGLKVRPL